VLWQSLDSSIPVIFVLALGIESLYKAIDCLIGGFRNYVEEYKLLSKLLEADA
jgi:hypothetical protein